MPTRFLAAYRHALPALLALAALLASGCASVLRVDSQVESFVRWDGSQGTPTAPQYYVFERLPSQHDGPTAKAQDELERWTAEELARVGWYVASEPHPARWRVTVAAHSVRTPFAPWERPPGGFWPGITVYGGWGRPGFGVGLGWPMHPRWDAAPYYQRAVAIVIRDATTGAVAYETRAAHDGRWNSTPELWQAIIRAALSGFPAPPAGTRRVDIDVPR
jgi:hypothetical protein